MGPQLHLPGSVLRVVAVLHQVLAVLEGVDVAGVGSVAGGNRSGVLRTIRSLVAHPGPGSRCHVTSIRLEVATHRHGIALGIPGREVFDSAGAALPPWLPEQGWQRIR